MRAVLILLLTLVTLNSAVAGTSVYAKKKSGSEVNESAGVNEDGTMQTAVQAVVTSLTPEQIGAFATCLEKYVDPETASNVTKQTLGDGSMQVQEGSYQNTQAFMTSPLGQEAIKNCNTHIESLLPKVQQQFQQDLSTKDQNPVPAAQ